LHLDFADQLVGLGSLAVRFVIRSEVAHEDAEQHAGERLALVFGEPSLFAACRARGRR
jgi:hypothetical protein